MSTATLERPASSAHTAHPTSSSDDTADLKDRAALMKQIRRRVFASDASRSTIVEYMIRIALWARNQSELGFPSQRWSTANMMLLDFQAQLLGRDPVGYWAGVRQWKKFGRSIRPERVSSPYTIWVPRTRVDRDDDAEPQRRCVGFLATDVYDYSDTISDDPDFVEPLQKQRVAAGTEDILDRLAASSPVPVTFRAFGGDPTAGYLSRDGIFVRADMPVGNRISTLAHELGHHHLGHLDCDSGLSRSDKEQEAELTAWLVCQMLGIDDDTLTENVAGYVAHWETNGEQIAGHKAREKLFKERFDAAFDAARTIHAYYAAC